MVDSITQSDEVSSLPIACTLPEDELASRRGEIAKGISTGAESISELPDGYELRFPGTEEWIAKLVTFIRQERACCRFLTFELTFEPDEGPISLRLRGAEGAKEFIKMML